MSAIYLRSGKKNAVDEAMSLLPSLLRSVVAAGAKDRRIRFMLVGGINTGFSYVLSCALYYAFYKYIHITIITSFSSLVSILFSFLMYRLFVFKTEGNFIKELLRCYVVYGGMLAVWVCGLWFLVDFVNISFWLAQLLLLAVIAVLSYLGHSRFTFASKLRKTPKSE